MKKKKKWSQEIKNNHGEEHQEDGVRKREFQFQSTISTKHYKELQWVEDENNHKLGRTKEHYGSSSNLVAPVSELRQASPDNDRITLVCSKYQNQILKKLQVVKQA